MPVCEGVCVCLCVCLQTIPEVKGKKRERKVRNEAEQVSGAECAVLPLRVKAYFCDLRSLLRSLRSRSAIPLRAPLRCDRFLPSPAHCTTHLTFRLAPLTLRARFEREVGLEAYSPIQLRSPADGRNWW